MADKTDDKSHTQVTSLRKAPQRGELMLVLDVKHSAVDN